MNSNNLDHQGPVSVYIDNCVWDFLFVRGISLAIELPRPEFCICMTREAEFEIPPIRDPNLRAFIDQTIETCIVQADVLFGFADPSVPLSEQRVAGFDQGRFARSEELAFMAQQRTPLRDRHTKRRKTGLYGDEADIALGARSFHSVVLTLDGKNGPLNNAYRSGGRIVFLSEFDVSGKSLGEFVRSASSGMCAGCAGLD